MKQARWVGSVGLVMLAFAQAAMATPFDSAGYTKKMQIRFAGYTQAGTLTNFPVLVQLAEGSNGFHYAEMGAAASGADLRFTDSSEANELNYELDTWTNGGTSLVWVQVPQLVDTNTTIYAWYGKSGATAPAYTTNGATWSEGFVGVWHCNEPEARDSTGRGYTGTPQNGVANCTGKIGTAQDFNGIQRKILLPAAISTNIANSVTSEAWGYLASSAPQYTTLLTELYDPGSGADGNIQFALGAYDNRLWAGFYKGGSDAWPGNAREAPSAPTLVWMHMAGVHDGTGTTLYHDGAAGNSDTATTLPTSSSCTKGWAIGHRWDFFNETVWHWPGYIDEVRLSNVRRLSNWIWAEHQNMASNRVFNLYSDAQSLDMILNEAPTNVLATSAFFNGFLMSTGSSAVTVSVLWGETSGGANPANWANTNSFDAGQWGPNSHPTTNITTLTQDRNYYYTYRAQNTETSGVAATPQYLITGALTVEATDAEGRTTPEDTATFTVSRPSTCAGGDLVVNYTLGGTATSGTDYAVSPASGSVVIPAGQTNGAITVQPVNKIDVSKTVTLTLAPGPYVIGSPTPSTCTLAVATTLICTWTGSSSTNWGDAGNWTPQAPGINDDPAIPGSATRWPYIPAGAYTNRNITIAAGGSVYCLGDTTTSNGVVLNVSNLTIAAGGTLNADKQGFTNNAGPGHGGIAQQWQGAGGGYGGQGGRGGGALGGTPYGSTNAPVDLGSGGSACDVTGLAYAPGGGGGGAIKINAGGTVTIDGTVTAKGEDTTRNGDCGGAGSGGSVWIVAGTLAGSGTIRTDGGYSAAPSANQAGGGGGGGRIALESAAGTKCPATISTAGGTTTHSGADYYGKDGSVHVAGALPLSTNAVTVAGRLTFGPPSGGGYAQLRMTIAGAGGVAGTDYGRLNVTGLDAANGTNLAASLPDCDLYVEVAPGLSGLPDGLVFTNLWATNAPFSASQPFHSVTWPVGWTGTVQYVNDAIVLTGVDSLTALASPEIANEPASNVFSTSAFFNGYLAQTGSSEVTVSVYWGQTNGDANAASWARTNTFAAGQWQEGEHPTTNITTLTQDRNYYYRYFAQGAGASAWATNSEYLITGDVTVEATDPTGRLSIADTAAFTVYRPATCTNEALTVYYTLSGTATNVNDYSIAPASGSALIPAGATTGTVTVTPVWKGGGDKSVILTLAAGPYPIGTASAAATCTLATAAATNCVWTGAASSNWTTQANWDPGLPRDVDTVAITNASGRLPRIPAGTYTFASLTITNGATLTCLGDTNSTDGSGLVLNVSDITIAAGSTLSADLQGFPHDAGPGKGDVINVYWQGTGGGYGGRGGPGNGGSGGPTYGSTNAPLALGSGGGQAPSSGGLGGAGGGAIKIVATGTATIDGTVTARGQYITGGDQGGAGSGGSIWIVAATLAGKGGILADGGYSAAGGASAGSGGGGGGRIALEIAASPGGPTNVNAVGGASTGSSSHPERNGVDGTVHVAGALPLSTNAVAVAGRLTFGPPSGGGYAQLRMTIAGAGGVAGTDYGRLTVTGLDAENGTNLAASIPNCELYVEVAPGLSGLPDGLVFTNLWATNAPFSASQPFHSVTWPAGWTGTVQYANDAIVLTDVDSLAALASPEIANEPASNVFSTAAFFNGYLSQTGSSEVTVSVYWGETNGGTNAADWARTNAFATGQWQEGEHPTANITTLTQDRNYYYRYLAQGAGASAWATNSEYLITGDVTVEASDPTGRLSIADTAAFTVHRPSTCTNEALTVYYTLSGTATNVNDYAIAPASGSAIVPAGSTTGTVTVTPVWKGGGDKTVILTLAPGPYPIGTAANAATCTLGTAAATNCVWTGAASSNWTEQANWDPGSPRDADAVTIANASGNMPRIPAGTYTFAALTITNGATLTCLGDTNSTEGSGLVLNVSDLAIAAGSTLSADMQGFPPNAGPGKGEHTGTYYQGAGGGHGGVGGFGQNCAGGTTYGSTNAPIALGSGGSLQDWCQSPAGAGGGAIEIVATGTATIDGLVTAAGQDAGGNGNPGGGGSGGSVWITAASLAGRGAIRANGGYSSGLTTHGDSVGGGGGGGGRIALEIAAGAGGFTNVNAAGGANLGSPIHPEQNGVDGTVYVAGRLDVGANNVPAAGRLRFARPGTGYSLLRMTIAGTNGVAGADYGRLTVTGLDAENGTNLAHSITNCELVVDVTPALHPPAEGLVITNVVATNALFSAGAPFHAVTWDAGWHGAVEYGDGYIRLTDVTGIRGTIYLFR